jgi:hypothetical protein
MGVGAHHVRSVVKAPSTAAGTAGGGGVAALRRSVEVENCTGRPRGQARGGDANGEEREGEDGQLTGATERETEAHRRSSAVGKNFAMREGLGPYRGCSGGSRGGSQLLAQAVLSCAGRV